MQNGECPAPGLRNGFAALLAALRRVPPRVRVFSFQSGMGGTRQSFQTRSYPAMPGGMIRLCSLMFAYVRICSLNSPIKNYGHCCWEKFWTGSRSDERAYPQGSGSKERQKRFFARQTNPILPNCMRHNNMQPPQLPCARLGIWRHLELLRVVTGCDGKCYGLNICKRLRINMCDGVTAWGGDILISPWDSIHFSRLADALVIMSLSWQRSTVGP